MKSQSYVAHESFWTDLRMWISRQGQLKLQRATARLRLATCPFAGHPFQPDE